MLICLTNEERKLYHFWENSHKNKAISYRLMETLATQKSPIIPKELSRQCNKMFGKGTSKYEYVIKVELSMFIKAIHEECKGYSHGIWRYHFNPERIKEFLEYCEAAYKERERRGCKCFEMADEFLKGAAKFFVNE